MEKYLTAICDELRNYFVTDADKHDGEYEVRRNTISLDFLARNQYFRVVGSVFNDGVWKYPDYEMIDETFTGSIWAMRVPQTILDLAAEVEAFDTDEANVPSPYTSESFGGYSYTKNRGTDGTSAYSWKDAFRSRLNRWRKVDFC